MEHHSSSVHQGDPQGGLEDGMFHLLSIKASWSSSRSPEKGGKRVELSVKVRKIITFLSTVLAV